MLRKSEETLHLRLFFGGPYSKFPGSWVNVNPFEPGLAIERKSVTSSVKICSAPEAIPQSG